MPPPPLLPATCPLPLNILWTFLQHPFQIASIASQKAYAFGFIIGLLHGLISALRSIANRLPTHNTDIGSYSQFVFAMNAVETRAAIVIVANNFVRLVRAISDIPTRRKLRRMFQSCIEFLHIWIQQQAAANASPSSGEIFAVTKCQLLQLGVSNEFVALLDPFMPCSHAQNSTISDNFDCWDMLDHSSPTPSASPATPSRKRTSSDCSLSDLSPLCNRQLLKHFRPESDR